MTSRPKEHSVPSSTWHEYTRQRPREPIRTQTFEALKIEALEAVACSHRGKPCHVNKLDYAYGGDNLVLEMKFDDGVIWMARLRLHEAKFLEPRGEYDQAFVSEVVTLKWVKRETTIPVPQVFVFDARYQNEVGQPYMLMEAMPGNRLWGGMATKYIPDNFKEKVYRQFADFMLQLYSHPFPEIGMLYPGSDGKEKIGEIVDQHARLPSYGPFTNTSIFYETRGKLVRNYYLNNSTEGPGFDPIESANFKLKAIKYIVDPMYSNGPFYIGHPDFQVTNFLFDDEFDVTAILDWTGCQTLPLESFVLPPMKIVPFADEFYDYEWGTTLPEWVRKEWHRCREVFLNILEEEEKSRGNVDAPVTGIIRSPRSYFAHLLDREGITGFINRLPRTDFFNWLGHEFEDSDKSRAIVN